MQLSIYVISLKKDSNRRNDLKINFKKQYDKFKIVEAIDGKSMDVLFYYNSVVKNFVKYKEILSPSEVGCSCSHIDALKKFIDSKYDYGLILEDDVIGDDQSINRLSELLSLLPENSIVICGGQEGLKGNKYIYGKNVEGSDMCLLSRFSLRYVSRACCYLVTRKSALHILASQRKILVQADKWNVLLNNVDKIFYSPLFSHPVDLKNSHIESERRFFRGKYFFTRLQRSGVFYTVMDNLFKRVFLRFLLFAGFKKIKIFDFN